ncbi:hypothetical protein [Haloglomus litoreum]|uniref:hypothetical protein n=1 Tax=Haloglomus litoreum TaxID=3034026 RepID=UPI0023E8235C|nr:hypothetical protein [Haloglomus sp. DT116]
MTVPQQAKEAVFHPITQLSAFVSLLGGLSFGWFEPVWTLISATSGYWFPAIAVSAGEIFPRVGLGQYGGPALLGAAIIFVAVQLDRLKDRAETWLNDR